MSASTDNDNGINDVDASLKEQHRGIIAAFSEADEQVVLTSEIAEHVNLVDRSVRRRLNDLVDEGIVGTRKPGSDRLWWLEVEVKEPITAQYPLLRFVRDRVDVQLTLIGAGLAVISAVLILAGAMAFVYGVSPPFVTRSEWLSYGIVASGLSATFIVVGLALTTLTWVARRFGEGYGFWSGGDS